VIHFYKAEVSDAQAIAQLVNSAYRGEVSRKGWTTEADLLDGLRTTTAEVSRLIQAEQSFILIGVLRDEVVASVHCQWQALAGHNTVHFGMIAVKPSLQNKGYGKQMIQAAEAITRREWRVAGFHMAVISVRHELIAFYERLGYQKTGEFVAFPAESNLWKPKVDGLNLQYLAKLVGEGNY
jgi:ribosomal protein S18 acetylase RimI-like enzyme